MAPTPTDRVGANVRAAMARRLPRVTQTDLAHHLEVSQAVVSKRLNGVTPFDINELVSIAHFLGVPLEALTEGADDLASVPA